MRARFGQMTSRDASAGERSRCRRLRRAARPRQHAAAHDGESCRHSRYHLLYPRSAWSIDREAPRRTPRSCRSASSRSDALDRWTHQVRPARADRSPMRSCHRIAHAATVVRRSCGSLRRARRSDRAPSLPLRRATRTQSHPVVLVPMLLISRRAGRRPCRSPRPHRRRCRCRQTPHRG
jgi:hypothetical protein